MDEQALAAELGPDAPPLAVALADRLDEAQPADAPGVRITGPSDGELRTLWRLAQVKTERRLGRPLATLADWNAVSASYDELRHKQRSGIAELAARAQERCMEIPDGD